jgi:uncharacterized protein YcbK (DUF882 family)
MAKASKHFSYSEFACKCGCGFESLHPDSIKVLEAVRNNFGVPVIVNSGCRCYSHNQKVGGSSNSQHCYARAADIVVQGVPPIQVYQWLDAGPLKGKGGLGNYATFTHADTRLKGPARWNG